MLNVYLDFDNTIIFSERSANECGINITDWVRLQDGETHVTYISPATLELLQPSSAGIQFIGITSRKVQQVQRLDLPIETVYAENGAVELCQNVVTRFLAPPVDLLSYYHELYKDIAQLKIEELDSTYSTIWFTSKYNLINMLQQLQLKYKAFTFVEEWDKNLFRYTISPYGYTKERPVQMLYRSMGLTAGFGDNFLDIPMLANVTYGFTQSNSKLKLSYCKPAFDLAEVVNALERG